MTGYHFDVKVVPDGDEVLALFGSFPIAGAGNMHLRARSEGIALETRPNLTEEKTEIGRDKTIRGIDIWHSAKRVFRCR